MKEKLIEDIPIKILKKAATYLLLFVALICVYVAILSVTDLIPSSMLENNVRKSSETMLKDGEKRIYDLKYKKECIFVFTDALMVNTAYSIDSSHPIQSFVLARKNYIPGQTKYYYNDSTYNLKANEKYINKQTEDIYQTDELYGLMHGDKIEDSYEYARYWHGYLAILRPLLVLFDYSAIRILLFVLTVILLATMAVLLYKKLNLTVAISYLLGLMAISILIATQSINEILIFVIALISIIILLAKGDTIKNIGIYFFIVGSVSNFIDLLTVPVVTLGLPAITYFLLLQKKEEKPDIKRYILEILKIGIAWTLGYAMTWAAKWVITEVFFNRPLISQAITQISFRTNGLKVDFLLMMHNLIFMLSKTVTNIIIILCTVYLLITACANYKKDINFKDNIKRCLPYILIFFFPIIWCAVVKQHSNSHRFFTYRMLCVSIISLFILVTKILEKEKEKQK